MRLMNKTSARSRIVIGSVVDLTDLTNMFLQDILKRLLLNFLEGTVSFVLVVINNSMDLFSVKSFMTTSE